MAWDPAQYLKFEDARLRPALELLAHVSTAAPNLVIDLGCGTGHITLRLAERWPDATVVGVDQSAAMLVEARAADVAGRVHWIEAELSGWVPGAPVDVLYSNSALHWLDDHDEMFPRLVSWLSPGGILAVQMPRNFPEPTHTCIDEVARSGPWRDRLEQLLRPDPVAPPEDLYDLLATEVAELDIWETVYLQVLAGEDAVTEWTRGSVLRPLLAALEPGEQAAFLERVAACHRGAYPPRDDGTTLLPFRRQFVVATR